MEVLSGANRVSRTGFAHEQRVNRALSPADCQHQIVFIVSILGAHKLDDTNTH